MNYCYNIMKVTGSKYCRTMSHGRRRASALQSATRLKKLSNYSAAKLAPCSIFHKQAANTRARILLYLFNLFSSVHTHRPSSSHAPRFRFNLYLSARYDCAVCGLCCCYIYYYIFIGMLLYELADIYRVLEHYSVCS